MTFKVYDNLIGAFQALPEKKQQEIANLAADYLELSRTGTPRGFANWLGHKTQDPELKTLGTNHVLSEFDIRWLAKKATPAAAPAAPPAAPAAPPAAPAAPETEFVIVDDEPASAPAPAAPPAPPRRQKRPAPQKTTDWNTRISQMFLIGFIGFFVVLVIGAFAFMAINSTQATTPTPAATGTIVRNPNTNTPTKAATNAPTKAATTAPTKAPVAPQVAPTTVPAAPPPAPAASVGQSNFNVIRDQSGAMIPWPTKQADCPKYFWTCLSITSTDLKWIQDTRSGCSKDTTNEAIWKLRLDYKTVIDARTNACK